MYPEDLRYHEGHAWVRQEGEEATIGVTQYATEEMGEIIFAELPDEGTEIERDEVFGNVESAKAVEDLLAPVSGTVVRRNEAVLDAPETINEDPYGEGWLIVVRMEDESSLDSLLSATEYRAHIDEAEEEADEEEAEVEEEEELPAFEEEEGGDLG
jgi:glycine cleavage system H protein